MDTIQTTLLCNQNHTDALGKFGQILMNRNDISRKSKLKWGTSELQSAKYEGSGQKCVRNLPNLAKCGLVEV